MRIALWSMTAGSNNAAPPDGFPENMEQRDFNDGIRELMAQIRTWYDAPQWQDFASPNVVSRQGATTVRIAGVDLTAYMTPGRIVRITGGGDDTGQINSSSFTAGNTDVVVNFSVPVGTDTIYVYMGGALRGAALLNTGTAPGQIPVNSGSGALGSAAYKDWGPTAGNLAAHTQSATLAAFAYRAALLETSALPTGGDQTTGGTAEVAITGLTSLAVPGTPNGVKQYRINATINIQMPSGSAGGGTAIVRLRMGNAGTIADALVMRTHVVNQGASGATYVQAVFSGVVVTPASGDKLTFSVSGVTGLVVLLGTMAGDLPSVSCVETGN